MRLRFHRFEALPALLALLTLSAAPVSAQTTTLDEGAFRILVEGREIGTETFSIRQNGTGQNATIIARGRSIFDTSGGTEELAASLQVNGPALRPAAYQVTVQGASPQQIAGRLVGGRFTARIISPEGEMMREYLASEGAVLVDDGIVHHYYFLARRLDGEPFRVPLIIPRQNRQVSARVTPRGTEAVEVDGERAQARLFVVEPAAGAARHVWVDARGRILRLEIPTQDYAARRVSLPR